MHTYTLPVHLSCVSIAFSPLYFHTFIKTVCIPTNFPYPHIYVWFLLVNISKIRQLMARYGLLLSTLENASDISIDVILTSLSKSHTIQSLTNPHSCSVNIAEVLLYQTAFPVFINESAKNTLRKKAFLIWWLPFILWDSLRLSCCWRAMAKCLNSCLLCCPTYCVAWQFNYITCVSPTRPWFRPEQPQFFSPSCGSRNPIHVLTRSCTLRWHTIWLLLPNKCCCMRYLWSATTE